MNFIATNFIAGHKFQSFVAMYIDLVTDYNSGSE